MNLCHKIIILSVILITYPQAKSVKADYAPQEYNLSQQTVGGAVSPVTLTTTFAEMPKRKKLSQASQYTQNLNIDQKHSEYACSCLKYATSEAGVHFGIAYARQMPTNATEPKIGAIVKTSENSVGSQAGHVGIITAVSDDTVTIREANYVRCAITSRTIKKDSPIILGYFIVR